jgi:translation initiation factor IF-1
MRIHHLGTITKVLKGHKFEVSLDGNEAHTVIAVPCGKMRIKSITLIVGDAVNLELSKYDLEKGRIIWRL